MKINFDDVLIVGLVVGGFLIYKVGQTINNNINTDVQTVATFGQNIQTGLTALANSPINAIKSVFGGLPLQTPDDPTGTPPSDDDGTSGIIGDTGDPGNIFGGIDFNPDDLV